MLARDTGTVKGRWTSPCRRVAPARRQRGPLHTHDGREVDLLLELEGGFVAIEVKHADRMSRTDARHLVGLDALVDKPVLARLVLSMDRDLRPIREDVLAVPAAWVFGVERG